MTNQKVLIAAPVHPLLIDGLRDAGYELIIQEQITQDMGMELIRDCVGVVTSTRLQLNREMIDHAPLLRFIGRMGSGMEVIDTAYAAKKGIKCLGSPEGNCNAVAEHTLGLLLAINKKIVKSHIEIKEGHWIREANRGVELEGKTIGIIGYGNTGPAFARLLKGFNVRILVYDKYKIIPPETHIEVVTTLSQLQDEAQVISVHVPYQEDTFHLINTSFINGVKNPFVLLNTSRGTVVDTRAVSEGLKRGKIAGFAADVWEEEPLEKMSSGSLILLQEMLQRPDTVITPHIAGYSYEALRKMSLLLLERITQ